MELDDRSSHIQGPEQQTAFCWLVSDVGCKIDETRSIIPTSRKFQIQGAQNATPRSKLIILLSVAHRLHAQAPHRTSDCLMAHVLPALKAELSSELTTYAMEQNLA
ncbi:hypothetical protein MJO28_000548 [Puccinia striiformis f. sp. tritici]|uniref:Uncharacterized protein n=1 Tax=Puccinia striiformis f. sp. tritici TaxID=168172 RepID=A0ACC0EZG2_9BASI|nr:hypothetical protein Pst134EA_000688 [Puccinia striiformis f. sp. tritici]KAH9473607.1 hypothetical protein Pst134EA_000688 [Puccinia striiformis f. sp. tritici]KAI7962454.1 hypothetical protein MJO28_000548 [Puccinia striiformis f. sp. tritici]KAI9601097.1 hypothetical protein H4Q26_000896 [Puccinia striiformis f. sp. tritici PST-130]